MSHAASFVKLKSHLVDQTNMKWAIAQNMGICVLEI